MLKSNKIPQFYLKCFVSDKKDKGFQPPIRGGLKISTEILLPTIPLLNAQLVNCKSVFVSKFNLWIGFV